MNRFLAASLAVVLFFSCRKADVSPQSNFLSNVQASLHDSLPASTYDSLDFPHAMRTDIDSIDIHLLRVPLQGQNIAAHFLLVKADAQGYVLKGRFITVQRDPSQKASFTGTLLYRSMGGTQSKSVSLVAGKIPKPERSNLMAEQEPEWDGGDLPPVVVSYTPSGGGFTYADWYNLVDMAGDGGAYSGGYYVPSSGGGGGGGNGAAPAEQVDFDYPENKDAVDISKYLKCFGATQSPAADYTISICVDLPVDADPSKFFNWSDASPGHTFIELYKNGGGGLVEQHLGFYPNTSWKTVVGPDNIASKIADDAGHEYQAKYSIAVTAAQFQQAMNAAQQYSARDYNVAYYNCADFALGVFRAAGGSLNVPQFQIPGFPSADGSNTPEGVYDAIAGLVLAGNKQAMANGQKQWIGNSHGPCE